MSIAQAIPEQPRVSLELPRKLQFLFRPSRFKVPYGGRGSAKSWSVARTLVTIGYQKPIRILCARELQNSITESVHRLLSDQIEILGLSKYYEIQQQGIYRLPHAHELRRGCTRGSEFFFYGIKSNPNKVKSAEGIQLVWVEEAEKVSEESWKILTPTIRAPYCGNLACDYIFKNNEFSTGRCPGCGGPEGSEIWATFNPDEESDPTYQRFVVNPSPSVVAVAVNWQDNPWFPKSLRDEKDWMARTDPEAYEHVWGGNCRKNSSAQIFRGKYRLEDFTPPVPEQCDRDHPMWDGPYFGADWGFAADPVFLTKSWIDNGTRERPRKRLMIEYEYFGVGIETDQIPTHFKRIPGVTERVIRADSSRPETINSVGRTGFCPVLSCDFTFNPKFPESECPVHKTKPSFLQVIAAEKWSGSIEDGIAYLKNFEEIVIHQSHCPQQAIEARLYSYKKDRLTGDVLAEIVDKNNHGWDSLRYAHEPMVKRSNAAAMWSRM